MKSLKDIIINARCRKGPAHNITFDGAYWSPFAHIVLRRTGGDGIGRNAHDVEFRLEFRHYRSGVVKAVVHEYSWHQNTGTSHRYHFVDICDLETGEDVVRVLMSFDKKFLSSSDAQSIIGRLEELGLKPCDPSPDEDAESVTEGSTK